MSNAAIAEVPQAAKGPALKMGETIIRGKLIGAKRPQGNGAFWENLLVMPAPDPYSSPATISILSGQRLGERDEDVTVRVRIGGYRRSYKATDRETGEIRTVQTADNKLFAIED